MAILSADDLYSINYGQQQPNPYQAQIPSASTPFGTLNPNAKGAVGISAEPPKPGKQFGSINIPQGIPSIAPQNTGTMPDNIYEKYIKQTLDRAITGGYIPQIPGTEFGGFSNIGQVASHAGTNIGSKGSGGSSGDTDYSKYIQQLVSKFGGK